ncbi:hydroxyisourate hydrolase [Paraglaciecola aquimarina]|uniref:5-hydroxyisourate hydrolase n=1 Tax=Paraglaciecola algarum TaxID=3050085 RepID=A0ABS9D9M7_9ALTE|nr:hydroxyisourate hydrolase [Paraglaciecola sp. G1-23]MCF2948713.1 hydroxyisourate hydrolase [Paraglaciecola sp. G1-23]
MNKSPITTHILNLESGLPAAGVLVKLLSADSQLISQAETDADGRIVLWPDELNLTPTDYKLHFAIADWYQAQGKKSFYPYVELVFSLEDLDRHYHVPLLLNAYGYSTYRGS